MIPERYYLPLVVVLGVGMVIACLSIMAWGEGRAHDCQAAGGVFVRGVCVQQAAVVIP